jgi:hypothetical protein
MINQMDTDNAIQLKAIKMLLVSNFIPKTEFFFFAAFAPSR